MLLESFDRLTLNPRVFFALQRLRPHSPPHGASVHALQLRKLKRLVVHAWENFEYYRARMSDAGFDPHRLSDVRELECLPILTRQDYRDLAESVFAADLGRRQAWHRDYTSGSSGDPLEVCRSWPDRAEIIARWLRVLSSNGWSPFDKVLSVGSPDRSSGRASLIQMIGLARREGVSYTLPVDVHVERFGACAPDVFYTTKTIMLRMAMLAIRRRIELPHPRLYVVGAETMDANALSLIESVFGSENRVEYYGSTELGALAFQLKGRGPAMHFCHDTHLLELVSEDGSKRSDFGRSVITDLDMQSIPLLRYDQGDMIRVERVDGVDVISEIRGRHDDWVVFEDGTRVAYHPFKLVFLRHPDVGQYRIVQHDLRDVEIVAVPRAGADRARLEAGILEDLRSRVHAAPDWRVSFVDHIPPDPNAKLRMVISHLEAGRMQTPLPPLGALDQLDVAAGVARVSSAGGRGPRGCDRGTT